MQFFDNYCLHTEFEYYLRISFIDKIDSFCSGSMYTPLTPVLY